MTETTPTLGFPQGDHLKAVLDATFRALLDQGTTVREAERAAVQALAIGFAAGTAVLGFLARDEAQVTFARLQGPALAIALIALTVYSICWHCRQRVKEAAERATRLEQTLERYLTGVAGIDLSVYKPFTFHDGGLWGKDVPVPVIALGLWISGLTLVSGCLFIIKSLAH